MWRYYILERTEQDKEFYFAHDGLFNFWNEYIIFHYDDIHIVLVNRSNREFHGADISPEKLHEVREILYEHYLDKLEECGVISLIFVNKIA